MKKRMILFTILMVLVASLSADFVEVGTGDAVNSYVPVHGLYDYSWSRTIYLQTDLINGMEIHTLSYKVSSVTPNNVMENQSFYLSHTTDSAIASTEYVNPVTNDSYVLVYSGSVTYNGWGWFDIILDTPFEYNGIDNLEIMVINNDGEYNTGYPRFYSTMASPQRSVCQYSDNFLPETPGDLISTYPNTRFHFTDENQPTVATLESPIDNSFNIDAPVELTWINGDNTDWVKIYFSDEMNEVVSGNQSALQIENYTQQSYTVEDLDPQTIYYWRIVSGNDSSESLAFSPIWSFTSRGSNESVIIGNGSEINTHLPMEAYYSYTISQTIYNQEFLNVENQRIEQIAYNYAGSSSWTEENIQVYLGHTELDEFEDGNSWILNDELVLVYDGPFAVTGDEGWVTVTFSVPFNYNNEDNLVVAFEANTPGYHYSNSDFLATNNTGNKSLYHYADSVNSDFITPVSGQLSTLTPNIMLTIGDIPTGPQLWVSPEEYSWDDTLIDCSANTVTFLMSNTGLDTLTINSLSIDQDVDFILTDNNTYPLELTTDVAEFTVIFHPLTVGNCEANIIINDAEIGDTIIPLSGTGYDGMLYDFPHFEGFEDCEYGEIPEGWSAIVNSSSINASVGVFSGGYEGVRCLKFFTSSDHNPELYAITPPIDELNSKRIRFNVASLFAGSGLVIGTAEDNSGEINFTARDTVLTTTHGEYQEYLHDFNGAENDDEFIAFKCLDIGSTNITILIDNVIVESAPSGPVLNLPQDNLNFGNVHLNRDGVALLDIENWGISPLEIGFSQVGEEFSFSPNVLSIESESNQNVMVIIEPTSEGEYSGSFELISNDPEHLSTTINTSAFILPPISDSLAVIGTGNLPNQGLPLYHLYQNSYSQSIYYAEEIAIEDKRIEKISWHYNGYASWGPDDLKIYMGHTSASQFMGEEDWLSIDEMTEVYNGSITAPLEDGWIEAILDIPFIYDNTQNLVVGVLHSTPIYSNASGNFYCTFAPANRSLLYRGSSYIPDPANPPTASNILESFPNITLEFGDIPNAPDLAITPNNLNFEFLAVDGSSEEQQITMLSAGLQDIIIAEAPTIIGENATDFTITNDNNTYPLVMSLNQFTTIGVSFTPNSEGFKNATVEILDNATRESHFVNLTGEAYLADNNNYPEDATILSLPVYGQTYSISPTGDIDWYKIPDMNTGDTLFVMMQDVGETSLHATMLLYGPVTDPTLIWQNQFIAYGSSFECILPGQGDYYLKISNSLIYPEGANSPHTRKNKHSESDRLVRDNTGFYNLYVDAIYQDGYNAPLSLEASNQAGYVQLTWDGLAYERYQTGYRVYRDDEMISEEVIPVGTNTYSDTTVDDCTEYSYYLRGVYEDPDGLSQPSNTVSIFYFYLETPLWNDGFEDQTDFSLDLSNWIQYDIDGASTYGISDIEFENSGDPMSYIVFNPTTTTPPIIDIVAQDGDKFLASFASIDTDNNDWIITPPIAIASTTVISFYVKSYTADYGLERFRVLMSQSGSQINDFDYSLHPEVDYLEAPTEWTPFYFDVSDIGGSTVRFAIQCVSSDAFMFMFDNFRVDSNAMDNDDSQVTPSLNRLAQNYPNPFNPETSISFSIKEAGQVIVDVYNIRGQKVKTLLNEYRGAGSHSVVWNGRDDDNQKVASGIYLYKMRNGKFSSTKKMILMK